LNVGLRLPDDARGDASLLLTFYRRNFTFLSNV